MDPSYKKRKADENGALATAIPAAELTPEDGRKIIDAFSLDQLRDIVAAAVSRGEPGVLADVRAIADRDQSQRKLFIRGLGMETTTDAVRSLFSTYGEIEEAAVIVDRATGKSKGYGFITFRHIDGALRALKEPSKKIDGRMTVTQLAAAGNSGSGAAPSADVSLRKIYVANVPADMPSDRLLAHFSSYGEIEEGPLGFDKQTGKFRGFALFVYKTVEGARNSLVDPNKNIDGHNLVCKLAIEGKKGKPGAPAPGAAPMGGVPGQPMGGGADMGPDGLGLGAQSSLPSSLSSQYGGPGSGLGSYGGYSGSALPGAAGLSHHHNMNSSLPSSMGPGTPGLSSVGSQVPSSLGGAVAGGYGGGLGGPLGSSQYGGPGSGGYGGYGMGSSLYRMPPSSVGMPSGGYPEGGHYPLSSSAYQGQHHQPAGSSPGQRVPGGGLYPNVPPYY
ncbi:UBP1-associated protein 2C-like [Musa acuminata AAA Group]|uniref:UBP1-associated protein 2C n=1 Tax=Musa acuminata AAA Group TaxID=214697 RepID=UPI0031D6CFC1